MYYPIIQTNDPSLQDETSVWRPPQDLSLTRRAGHTRIWAQLALGG